MDNGSGNLQDAESILFMADGSQTVFRFTIPELREEIHRCEIKASVHRNFGEDEDARFFEWLTECLKAALKILNEKRFTTHAKRYPRNTDTESLKAQTDIVEFIGQRIQLKKAGKVFTGLCPFHDEKHPSFTVYADTQTWHCFSCHRGGDVLDFLMLTENIDFKAALHILQGVGA